MQIACPACDAQYEVPPSRLAAGKRVKCARCGESWTPLEAVEPIVPIAAAPEPPAEPAPEPQRLSAAEPDGLVTTRPDLTAPEGLVAMQPASPPSGRLVWAGWAATALILIVVVLAAAKFRLQIEDLWPPSRRLYDAF